MCVIVMLNQYSWTEHATAGDDRELYEGIPDVDSGDICPNQSIVTAPPHHPGYAQTLYNYRCMFKYFNSITCFVNNSSP